MMQILIYSNEDKIFDGMDKANPLDPTYVRHERIAGVGGYPRTSVRLVGPVSVYCDWVRQLL